MKFIGMLMALFALTGLAAADPVVTTDSGRIEGLIHGDIAEYRGVPFAQPPLAGLRWQAPRPVKHWPGIRKANQFPAQCSQLGPPLPTMPEEPTSEDCLYLNLWTPAIEPPQKLPVMVFFYGGGFVRGSASTPLYASGGLTQATGVIVVTVNYRLGALGFLAHPELSAESPHHTSGNYALLDAIAGLKWVKRNISAFGGDPDCVTIFGQSAGSYLINKLMISPPARGLFHAVIAESSADMGPTGTNEGLATLADAEKAGVAFARSLGARSITELRRVSAEKITASDFAGLPGIYGSSQTLPIVDGYLIPRDTHASYLAGQQAPVPLLLGYNLDEGQYFESPTTVAEYFSKVSARYGIFAERMEAAYPAHTDEEAAHAQSQLTAEHAFGWQMWSWARANASSSHQKTYFYFFSSKYGNGHGAELPYVFQYPFDGPWNDEQRDIGRKIVAYWTQFAKTGDPNRTDLPPWPSFDIHSNATMLLGDQFESGTTPELDQHALMEEYMNSKRTH